MKPKRVIKYCEHKSSVYILCAVNFSLLLYETSLFRAVRITRIKGLHDLTSSYENTNLTVS